MFQLQSEFFDWFSPQKNNLDQFAIISESFDLCQFYEGPRFRLKSVGTASLCFWEVFIASRKHSTEALVLFFLLPFSDKVKASKLIFLILSRFSNFYFSTTTSLIFFIKMSRESSLFAESC